MSSTLLLSNIDTKDKKTITSNTKTGLLRHWSSQPNLRSKASVSLVPMHAQAKTYQANPSPPTKEEGNDINSLNTIAYVARKKNHTYLSDINRTQHKLMLQRQCFLADDKNYLNHPSNMKRLTKEIDRVNREYNSICQNEINPMTESILRITNNHLSNHHYVHPLSVPQQSLSNHHHHHPWSSSLSSSSSTSVSNNSLSSSSSLSALGNGVDSYFSLKMTSNDYNNINNNTNNNNKLKSPILQRRASDFMLKRQERRDSSISIHSTILQQRQDIHQQNGSKHPFFSRFFKPSLPPNQSNNRHSLLSW